MYPETILPITAHIPHAGTGIPEAVRSQFIPSPEELWREIALVTDWYTAELFGLPGIATTQTLISRVVVDLERYSDDSLEEKSSFGQGVIYTHNALGEKIWRELSLEEKRLLLDTYYRPWHLQLEVNLEQQLQRWGYSLLLDCHSFPDEPFAHEDDQGRHRPDICLGVCCNTPQWLLDSCTGLFLKRGYTVDVDFPYSGCVVPEHFAGDTRVPAVMLEINRRLYLMPAGMESYRLENIPVKATGFEPVRNDIREVMLCLAQESACRLERLPWCNPGSGRGS